MAAITKICEGERSNFVSVNCVVFDSRHDDVIK